eukprot:EC788613.1.p2 GENE.EC788613.1~~EC788613.1.p2  ORF type:complete len:80 (-),score=3.05 EC788613.1:7-246(-)
MGDMTEPGVQGGRENKQKLNNESTVPVSRQQHASNHIREKERKKKQTQNDHKEEPRTSPNTTPSTTQSVLKSGVEKQQQ